jgi:histidine triad (HIT) family protein
MNYDNNNIFAKILRGEIFCEKLLENDYFLALKDRFPKAPIHALVIVKKPYLNIFDFNTNASFVEINEFYLGVAKTIEYLKLKTTGCKIISNMGEDGNQEIMHYHIHILGGAKLS